MRSDLAALQADVMEVLRGAVTQADQTLMTTLPTWELLNELDNL